MTTPATVSMSWANTVLAAAERMGVTRAKLLAQAGIDRGELACARWPVDHITRLWHAAVAATGDAGFGLKAGSSVGPANFNVVSGLVQSAPTLRAALALVPKFQRLISDGGRVQFIAGVQAGWMIYHPRQGQLAFSPQQIEAVLAASVCLMRWVSGNDFRPLRVQLSHARLGALAGYRAAFGCAVDFEQAFSGVLLANAVLDAPLPRADARLARLHRQEAQAQLAALAAPEDLVTTLQTWITVHLQGDTATRPHAAAALGLSERTLARRLHAKHTSFAALYDAARRDAALAAVAAGDQPLADIALALGFAEPSPFWRAFKRWTGSPPERWQRHASHQPPPPHTGRRG
ncbi:MAG: AraC family transcriptional regulator [Rhodanobacter sp.]|nr:MAG: AraC family transcriptional regulator [Rhodanobacter sp.]TAM13626.1 MAG: AraC family transcriptional regulator [Rhodanobacter sp.]TAM35621.1 MAG: AraC family transcriptional regulator [Rhodanobacter sp.]